jgi:hypothetical protein
VNKVAKLLRDFLAEFWTEAIIISDNPSGLRIELKLAGLLQGLPGFWKKWARDAVDSGTLKSREPAGRVVSKQKDLETSRHRKARKLKLPRKMSGSNLSGSASNNENAGLHIPNLIEKETWKTSQSLMKKHALAISVMRRKNTRANSV